VHGELVCGPETLSEQELAKNRADFGGQILAHPMDDKYHRDRSPVWEKVKTPLFSSANWGGQGLHPRGNFEGFVRAASKQKWLEAHGIEHWTHFYTDYGREQQLRLYELRARFAEALLRQIPQRRGRGLVQSAQSAVAGAPPGREIRRARRE